MPPYRRFAAPPAEAIECVPVPLSPMFLIGAIPQRCPVCHTDLATHQPDPELDDRLLGTCRDCKAWYVIDLKGRRMLLLPDP